MTTSKSRSVSDPRTDRDAHTVAITSVPRSSDTTASTVLEARNLGVTYGRGAHAVRAIGDITFDVRAGEFVTIVGPSGCGKTTLLKSLSGLLRPTAGQVRVNGTVVKGVAPGLALVFQEYSRSLFPWLRVRANVAFPLRGSGIGRMEIENRVTEALNKVGLHDISNLYPWQLSGGMQQRVAIARALAFRPSVLLMDEPFGSLDAQVRADLEDLLLQVHAEAGITVVLVTHDIDEAVYLGDRVIALSHRPTRVRSVIDVDLPRPRDQLHTKASPKFIDLRTQVLELILSERSTPATP